MIFEVGDKVCVEKKSNLSSILDNGDWNKDYEGKCGTITKVRKTYVFPYSVAFDGNTYRSSFHHSEITLVEKGK